MPVLPDLEFDRGPGVILGTIGTHILNWSMGEDLIVDIGRKSLL